MSDRDREVLFSNESFVIGMLQAVSGGSIVAALSQLQGIVTYAGRTAFLLFLTAMAASLAFAVLAAYWKHQYKMWDVKAGASYGTAQFHRLKKNDVEAEAKESEGDERSEKSARLLKAMRGCMALAVVGVLFGIAQLVVEFWSHPFPTSEPNKVLQSDAPKART